MTIVRCLRRLTALAALAWLAAGGALAALPELMITVEVDPKRRSLSARAALEVEGTRFSWQLQQGLELLDARVDGRPAAPEAELSTEGSRRYSVALPRGGGAHRIELRYSGTLAPLPSGSDHRSTLFRMPAMADAQGTFLPSAAHWYPRPEGLFRYAIEVRTPAGQRAVAPGRLESEELTVQGNRARFVFDHPAEGLDLMVGPYQVAERAVRLGGGEQVRLRAYFHAELAGLEEGYLSDTEEYLRRHSAEIGPYPFTEFSIVSSPLPTGFGMPGLTYLGREVLKLPFIRKTSLGHEIVHNWWGNGVYPADSGGNWAEGLTTFMADYAYKEERGEGAEARHGWLRDYASLAEGSERPLAAFTSRTHTASATIGYNKSAMLFYMLREEMGAERFSRALARFWAAYRFRPASFVDLRSAFAAESERPLNRFFDQWLTRTGAPRISVRSAGAKALDGEYRLELTLAQDTPAYALRLPIRVLLPNGSQDHVVRLDGVESTMTLRAAAQPSAVQIDPEFTLWRRLAAGESPPILREAQTAPRPALVVLDGSSDQRAAARRLAERFFENAPRTARASDLAALPDGALIVGSHDAVQTALRSAGLPARPVELEAATSARIWVHRTASGARVFVSLDAPTAVETLDMLAHRLPHFGRYSWIGFVGAQIDDRGVWPARSPSYPVSRAD